MKVLARVTRTYHVDVDADFGDTVNGLLARARDAARNARPDGETAVILSAVARDDATGELVASDDHTAAPVETEVETPQPGEPRSGYPSPEEIKASIANPRDPMTEPPPLPGGER